jgi:alanyl-tRNA synthetase
MTMTSAQIRQAFLDYFQEMGHTVLPSSSLVPVGDPTLLFTNAGMNQFKDVFLGLEQRPYRRATTAQKCMRVSGKHNDLENVGPSPRHHTFFEMLGNFSFGDYFKEDAVRFAWDFLTSELQLPLERLWFTVYEKDDEAAEAWRKMGASPERILRFGEKDNYWAMGDTGPCGPCSEIHYYIGDLTKQSAAGVNHDDDYIEIWNLVFMQYNRDAAGRLTPLPRPSVDTGMGLERIAMVMQGARATYETDLFRPILRRIQALLGETEEATGRRLISYRVIADHARALAFLIGDGVLPANEGRGYVLRLILRRAARHGRLLGFEHPFLAAVADAVIQIMGDHYTELRERQDFIKRVITQEEERFQQTLNVGMTLVDELIRQLRSEGRSVIPGDEAFRLYDTYGFPLDLTKEMAKDHGMTVDEVGFRAAMEKQREQSRAASQFVMEEADEQQRYARLLEQLRQEGRVGPAGVDHPYDETTQLESQVLAILKDGRTVPTARPGDAVEVVLAATPFYVESGGQVSDTGLIAAYPENVALSPEGTPMGEPRWEIEVEDTREPVSGLIVHIGKVTAGTPRQGDSAWALVDMDRRWDIMRNHTATHLLHSELRYVLGEHVHQAGSLVAPDRLRFDFTHPAMMTQDELDAVERLVNDAILAAYPVETDHSTYKEAVSSGAIALFGEKYGEVVRVVRVGWDDETFSKELCGGTHVSNTSEIGLFHIISESSVGSGIRRIEAVTGRVAQRMVQERMRKLEAAASYLGCQPDEVDRRVLNLLDELENLRKEVARLRRTLAQRDFERLLARAEDVKGTKVLAVQVEAADAETMREMSDWFRARLGSSVIVLGAAIDNKPSFVAAITPDLVERGLHAGHLVKVVAQAVGGGGGGKPTLAQAGGRDLTRLAEALSLVRPWVEQRLDS